jgi:class 3 adenylate cyclase/tetratricopeptide (TPR) repeat protein
MKFCGNCAAALKNLCPRCGFENPAQFRFCGQCAAPLRAEARPSPPPSRPASPRAATEPVAADAGVRIGAEPAASESIEGERKTVTALFADIKGSMEMIEDLDPEQARGIVDPALQLMIDAVHRYDGYIVQSTGDGIFALFGAPLAHEDHPQRAIYAALRMQEEMRKYAARLREAGSPPVEIRVGANTGDVVVRTLQTGDAHAEYTPIGHSTSLAARMQALAPTGSIAITAHTQNLVAGYFELRPLGPARIKGVSEPLEVYEVTGLGPLRTRLQRSATRGLSRFVGRRREMEQLRRALGMAAGGHGQIVAAVAEAGVGKSRLFHEFKLTASGRCPVLEAFSVSHGKASAYLPVIELLKGYFRIDDLDGDRARREKVTGKVLALDRALEDILPYIFAVLGGTEPGSELDDLEPRIRRRRMHDAIKRLILRESLNQPLMVIFEDLHWIDSESQALVEMLAESIGTARILMMVNYRPEYSHNWGGKTYYTQLRLDPLGRETAGELLAGLIGEETALAPLKDLIIARTDGNPFFIEEMVQALFDQGVLARNGKVRLANPLSSVRIPPTVKGILAARIDRLAPAAKELLQTLAVIGKEFPLGLVRAVVGRGDEELEPLLERLQLAEFIYEQPAITGVEYTFKHALTQEVAYDTVLSERRRQIHERAALAIESLFAGKLDDHLAELAHHFARSGNADKAIDYLTRAGEQARQRSAVGEAIGYFERAMELLKSEPESIDRDRRELSLLLAIGPMIALTRGFAAPEVQRCLDRARLLCERIGETPAKLAVVFSLWNLEFSRGRMRDAAAVAAQLLTLAERVGDEAMLATAHGSAGATSLWSGLPAQARPHLEQAIAISDRDLDRYLASMQVPVVPSRCHLAWTLWLLGFPDQAMARVEQALALANRLGRAFSIALSLQTMIALSALRGDFETIRPRAEALLELAREHEFAYWIASANMSIGRVTVGEGNHGAGIEKIRTAVDALSAVGAEHHFGHLLLVESFVEARRLEEGLAVVAAALETIEQTDQRLHEAELHRLGGELLLLVDGRAAEAERSFLRALEIARRQQARGWELRAATSLARLMLRDGRGGGAREILAPVYAQFTEGMATADLAAARALLAELAG